MHRSTQYAYRFLFFAVVVILPTVGVAPATNVKNQNTTVADGALTETEIPTGYKFERYAPVWERNPFTLVAPVVTPSQRSKFDNLFLTSWLKDGLTNVVFVQNLETNEVRKITAEPNQDRLRLIELHLNPNPQLVEALISDGKEQGLVRFRFDAQLPSGNAASPVAQTTKSGGTAQPPNSVPEIYVTSPQPQSNLSNAQTAPVPYNQPVSRRLSGGSPKLQTNSGPGRVTGSEGNRFLPLPPSKQTTQSER